MDSVLALNPADPGSILGIPENFSLDVAEIYRQQQHYYSGQRLTSIEPI